MIRTKLNNHLISGLLAVTLILAGCASKPTYDNDVEQLAAAKKAFVQHEYVQAAYLLEPLAIKGNAQAQYTLGYLYYYGLGVTQNTGLAKRWIASAANSGHEKAQQALELVSRPPTGTKEEAPTEEGESIPAIE